MRNLRILTLILGCYLAGWVTADLLVPVILARRGERSSSMLEPATDRTASAHSSQPPPRTVQMERP